MQTQTQTLPSPGAHRQFSVLVVDDERDIADSAREVIERLVPHCRVETADSCVHGLDAVRRQPFDAVLVDYRMPERNGLEFIRQVHELEPDLPAILMTAYGSIEMAVQAVNACHVDGFLSKPVDALRLAETVEDTLRRSTGQAPGAAGDGTAIHW